MRVQSGDKSSLPASRLAAGLCFGLGLFALAAPLVRAESSDTIAIRVIANPGHLSALDWFKAKEFEGSPQSISVDGYRGIRNGRTAYVNAANIVPGAGGENVLYTNIYVLSYNQEAEKATIDIFSRVLSSWKFNTNIDGAGECQDESGKICLLDSDCPEKDFCGGDKARIIRDVRRLEAIAGMKAMIEGYAAENGRYPALAAGTYLPQTSLSVWPSWQGALARELGRRLEVDPVNRLGDCGAGAFDPVTCWDETAQRFADADPASPSVDLPAGSRVFMYSAAANGGAYTLCAVMESGLVAGVENGACDISEQRSIGGQLPNNPPAVSGGAFNACLGDAFSAYAQARDPDGDPLSWQINTAPASQWARPSDVPRILSSLDQYQKQIAAATVSPGGPYRFSVTVDDGRGGSATGLFTITIQSCARPVIERIVNRASGAVIYDRAGEIGPLPAVSLIGSAVDWEVISADPDGDYPLAYEFSGLPDGFNSGGALAANGHDYNIRGMAVSQTREYSARIMAYDRLGNPSNPLSLSLRVYNDPPVISSLFDQPVTGCRPYAPANNRVAASDPNAGHIVEYLASGLPGNLRLDGNSGVLSGTALVPGGLYPVTITARDNYYAFTVPIENAQDTEAIDLQVADYDYQVTPPLNREFYVYPAGIPVSPDYIYHFPISYIGQPSVPAEAADMGLSWSMTSQPPSLPLAMPGLNMSINPNSGLLNGSAIGSAVPAGGFSFELNVRSVTDHCLVARQSAFALRLLPNEWCGDGITQSGFGENCDDGRNGDVTDRCRDDCRFTVCGDGTVQNPNGEGVAEQCDDFSSRCDMPPSLAPGTRGPCTPTFCGDGRAQDPNGAGLAEQCDDGNAVNGDGCNTAASNCQFACGDGAINRASELCDRGLLNTNTPCAAPYGGTCTYCDLACVQRTVNGPRCGDGIVNGAEQCDGGNLNSRTCATQGFTGGTLACNSACAFNTAGCYLDYIWGDYSHEIWVNNGYVWYSQWSRTITHTGFSRIVFEISGFWVDDLGSRHWNGQVRLKVNVNGTEYTTAPVDHELSQALRLEVSLNPAITSNITVSFDTYRVNPDAYESRVACTISNSRARLSN